MDSNSPATTIDRGCEYSSIGSAALILSLPRAGEESESELAKMRNWSLYEYATLRFVILASFAEIAQAQNREAALAAVMKLPAAERQARLLEGAKKENGLVWYSSTTAEDALALTKKFNEQHPSIQIQHFRSSSEKLLERILAESRANAFKADLVTLPEFELSIMIKRKLLVRYEGIENALYPAGKPKTHAAIGRDFTPPRGCRRHNTKLVSKDARTEVLQRSAQSEVERRHRHGHRAVQLVCVSLRYLERRDGKEAALDYMKKLAAQQMQWRKGHSLIGQLMAAGEFPIAAELQVHTVERAKAQGAPVEWSVLDGVIPISKVAAAITSTGDERLHLRVVL